MKMNDYLSRSTLHIRELGISAKVNEETRSVELSFSSANGIQRFDWWSGEMFTEVLDHSRDAVDLKRLQSLGVALFNHNMDRVIGRLEDVRLDEKEGKCRCRITFDEDPASEEIYQKVRSGTLKGISVGYRVQEWEEVKRGKVSGEGIKGPAMIARKWEPHEVSVVSCPADPNVGIGRSIFEGEDDLSMKFREIVQEALRKYNSGEYDQEQFNAEIRCILAGVDPEEMEEAARYINDIRAASGIRDDSGKKPDDEGRDDDDDEEEKPGDKDGGEDDGEKDRKTKRFLEQERQRAAEISAVCTRFGIDAAQTKRFIEEGTPLVDVYRSVMEHASKGGVSVGRSVETGEDERDKYRRAVVDGYRMRMGAQIDKPAPGAEEFRHLSLLDLARDILDRNGEQSRRVDPMTVASRAFSTSDFPAIMSNLADVVLKDAYNEAATTWRSWCRVGSVKDFKENRLVRMGELPMLEPVPEGGEYKMADLVETKDSYSIGTFGKKFALTRQAIINDDLGAFTRIPQLFGASAARTINHVVYGLLKSNPKVAEDGKAIFHADHNNLAATGTAITIEALDAARIAMRRQTGLRKDKEKVTLNITPTTLLIPPELETSALQLLYSATDIRYANANVKNPFLNAFTIIVEQELEPYEWYLLASPSAIDTMEVAFLNGQQSPTLEQQQGWNVDGIEYKIRLDFGAWLYEYRGMYKNPGAAPAAVGA